MTVIPAPYRSTGPERRLDTGACPGPDPGFTGETTFKRNQLGLDE
jgi:hypothetical protein